jgi:2-C-methyl-D-erythritol 2,4-cyclodiphosphate synthase
VNQLPDVRTGLGFDAHRLVPGRRLKLGGVIIPHPKGLAGHSDADVLLHALIDALLGAMAEPDIGTRFPDTDPAFKDADSTKLLAEVLETVTARGFSVLNASCVLVCDEPKLVPHAASIRARLAELLSIDAGRVGLSAKTAEGTQLAIPGQSIAALVTVLVAKDS